MTDAIKIYRSRDTVLIRSPDRDVEISNAEAYELFDALVEGSIRKQTLTLSTPETKPEAAPFKPTPLPPVPQNAPSSAKDQPQNHRLNLWTRSEDERLRAGHIRGERMSVIAKSIGRTRMACAARLAKKHRDLPRRKGRNSPARLAAE